MYTLSMYYVQFVLTSLVKNDITAVDSAVMITFSREKNKYDDGHAQK